MTDTVTEQRQREKGIISRIKQGILPTPEEAMDVLNYEKVKMADGRMTIRYTGKAAGLQMVIGVRMMLQEAVWWAEGGSGSLSHSGKVNMGNITTEYFNIASRERQKQAILVWGCGISLTYWCMKKELVSNREKHAEIEQWWEDYEKTAAKAGAGERFMFKQHPSLTPEDCYPTGFSCLSDYHIVGGVLQDINRS
tara:strand:+ start:1924 stop:2508 length:585 start_codon:yes stop_codon:yes gene_type:complete